MKRTQKYAILLGFGLVALLSTAPTQAQDPLPTRANSAKSAAQSGDTPAHDAQRRAALLLSGYHDIPAKSVFDAKLDAPQKVLMEFARDPSILPLQRQRALEALAYYADAEVEALYRDLLQDKMAAELMRHRVMPLLATRFPKSALPVLKPFLGHADLQFRLSAIGAIGQIPGAAAHQALQAAAKSEAHPVAQKRLAKLLRVAR